MLERAGIKSVHHLPGVSGYKYYYYYYSLIMLYLAPKITVAGVVEFARTVGGEEEGGREREEGGGGSLLLCFVVMLLFWGVFWVVWLDVCGRPVLNLAGSHLSPHHAISGFVQPYSVQMVHVN